ncbi:hydantoinase/oxoprolinase family protein [Rhodovibrionaceae bacterium A322]
MSWRMAVDVGGTFTDGVLIDDKTNRLWVGKALTTHGDPGDGIASVVTSLLAQQPEKAPVDRVIHGTTLITNTLLERKGVRTSLIVTRGTADLLDIRREMRYDTYDLNITFPEPLARREDRYETSCRLGPDGSDWQQVDPAELESIARQVAQTATQSVAVCFLHSPVSNRHEEALRAAFNREAPHISLSLSSEVAAEIGEYERMSTVVANAYVQPIVETYLNKLSTRLLELGVEGRLDIMVSNGGFTEAQLAARFPIRLLESGPAGGVLGAINCAADSDRHVLAFDMGGTTAKSCVAVDGKPEIAHIFEFSRERRFKQGSGLPAVSPSIDLIEIGAGGGSLARINALGLLQVGPDSAGSEPGPACYGLGGQDPTVTDADLLLGYLDPDNFLGGRMTLDLEQARAALGAVGQEIGLTALETAWGIHDIVNENMAAAARTHIAEKGLDARQFVLVATGGAGPVHAVDVARRLRIRRILCPLASGVGSCLGFLTAPARTDRSWSKIQPLENLDSREIARRFSDAKESIAADLAKAAVPAEQIQWHACVEMRYVGQGANVEVALDPDFLSDLLDLRRAFEEAYIGVFGRKVPGGIPEVVTWRIWGSSPSRKQQFNLGKAPSEHPADIGSRQLYWPDLKDRFDTPVFQRHSLPAGEVLRAPCVICEPESTLVVAYPATVSVLESGSIEVLLDEVSA